MQFQPLDPADSAAVNAMSRLATAIVREYFDPIIGEAQNSYMLARFQTPAAIASQLAQGYRYYFVRDEAGQNLGFLAFYPQGDHLYLSKFYLAKNQRGRGYARAMLDFVIAAARALGLGSITLNVYKHNGDTRAVYEHLGFTILRSEENDIGGGFIMNDYVYELRL